MASPPAQLSSRAARHRASTASAQAQAPQAIGAAPGRPAPSRSPQGPRPGKPAPRRRPAAAKAARHTAPLFRPARASPIQNHDKATARPPQGRHKAPWAWRLSAPPCPGLGHAQDSGRLTHSPSTTAAAQQRPPPASLRMPAALPKQPISQPARQALPPPFGACAAPPPARTPGHFLQLPACLLAGLPRAGQTCAAPGAAPCPQAPPGPQDLPASQDPPGPANQPRAAAPNKAAHRHRPHRRAPRGLCLAWHPPAGCAGAARRPCPLAQAWAGVPASRPGGWGKGLACRHPRPRLPRTGSRHASPHVRDKHHTDVAALHRPGRHCVIFSATCLHPRPTPSPFCPTLQPGQYTLPH